MGGYFNLVHSGIIFLRVVVVLCFIVPIRIHDPEKVKYLSYEFTVLAASQLNSPVGYTHYLVYTIFNESPSMCYKFNGVNRARACIVRDQY